MISPSQTSPPSLSCLLLLPHLPVGHRFWPRSSSLRLVLFFFFFLVNVSSFFPGEAAAATSTSALWGLYSPPNKMRNQRPCKQAPQLSLATRPHQHPRIASVPSESSAHGLDSYPEPSTMLSTLQSSWPGREPLLVRRAETQGLGCVTWSGCIPTLSEARMIF